jgi:hypothetical protein
MGERYTHGHVLDFYRQLLCSHAKLGWTPRLGIRESVIRTVQFLQQHDWVLNAREVMPANAG